MANLTRFNPFRALTRFDPFPRELDEFFKSSWPSLHGWDRMSEQFPIDVNEDEKSFKVRAEILGFAKDEISVSVVGDKVTINAESRKTKEEKKGEQVILCECYYGKQSRSFLLPQEVDAQEANAKYADGVLELVLPKKGGSSRMATIAIQ